MQPIRRAERILSHHFNTAIHLHQVTKLRSSTRSHVYRCTMGSDAPTVPAAVILKQATRAYGARVADAIDGNVWYDWAGLRFLGEIFPDTLFTPVCYGGDRTRAHICRHRDTRCSINHILLTQAAVDPTHRHAYNRHQRRREASSS
jgi:hypothetical protein